MSGFDFDAAVTAPFRMQPGLRRLAPGTPQLHELATSSPVFAAKLAVLERHADDALVGAQSFDPRPAWCALAALAAECGAPGLQPDADGLSAAGLGWRVDWHGGLHRRDAQACDNAGGCLASLRPDQRIAGLLSLALHEDLAIVDGASASLPCMAVCLPSHWVPRDKVGRSFAEVHAPVADNATLLAAAEHLSRLVCGEQRWERFVWTVTPHGRHDQHPHRSPTNGWQPGSPQDVAAQAHWRTEHQTFIPLPQLKQAVFTIRVEIEPLARAIDSPGRAAALHAALASMSGAVLAYRGLAEVREPLLQWLQHRADR